MIAEAGRAFGLAPHFLSPGDGAGDLLPVVARHVERDGAGGADGALQCLGCFAEACEES
jgi:hypothetical protein